MPPPNEARLQELARQIHVVEPDGYFANDALRSFFVHNLPLETIEHLANSSDALWVSSDHAALKNGRLYCFAMIGLTEQPPAQRNPRLPASSYHAVNLVKPGEDQSNEGVRLCRVRAVEAATAAMSKDSLEQQKDHSDRTRDKGTPVRGEKPNPKDSMLFSAGVPESIRPALFQAITPEAEAAFDYRKLEWVARASLYRLEDRTVCHASVGVAARALDGRNPRDPGHAWMRTWEMTPEESLQRNAEETCLTDVLTGAIAAAVREPWDKSGLLDGFEVTKEDGIPLVTAAARKRPAAQAPASMTAAAESTVQANAKVSRPRDTFGKCQPPAGKVLRYNDRCINGDCTRTFENGCSIRFQAPYCYDALSGQWAWKPNGC